MESPLSEQTKDLAEAVGSWQRHTIVAVAMTAITVFAVWSMRDIAEQALRLTNAAIAACGDTS